MAKNIFILILSLQVIDFFVNYASSSLRKRNRIPKISNRAFLMLVMFHMHIQVSPSVWQRQSNKKARTQYLSSSVFTTWIIYSSAIFRGCDSLVTKRKPSSFHTKDILPVEIFFWPFTIFFEGGGPGTIKNIMMFTKIHDPMFTQTPREEWNWEAVSLYGMLENE